MSDSIIKRILVKCVRRDLMKPLAIHFEEAHSFQQVREFIMRQMHDELAGMLEGDASQPVYNLEGAEQTEATKEEADSKEEEWSKEESEKWMVAPNGKGGTGGKGNASGKGK